MVMKTMRHVFSISDHHHAIISAATLYLCQCLSQCPIQSAKDIASGLLICTILLEYTSETEPPRLVPEVITYVRTVAQLLLPQESSAKTKSKRILHTVEDDVIFLRGHLSDNVSDSTHDCVIPWEYFREKSGRVVGDDFTIGSFNSSLVLTDVLAKRHGNDVAAVEILSPLLESWRSVSPQLTPALPTRMQEAYLNTVNQLKTAISVAAKSRKPLLWRVQEKKILETLTPKFDANYAPTKDVDPDKDRVQMKQMNRQLKREKKAAMRELTRDADFLDQERYKEQLDATNKRKAERAKNFAWMEEQQASLKLQVKQGKGLLKGGGSGVLRKVRVKR